MPQGIFFFRCDQIFGVQIEKYFLPKRECGFSTSLLFRSSLSNNKRITTKDEYLEVTLDTNSRSLSNFYSKRSYAFYLPFLVHIVFTTLNVCALSE